MSSSTCAPSTSSDAADNVTMREFRQLGQVQQKYMKAFQSYKSSLNISGILKTDALVEYLLAELIETQTYTRCLLQRQDSMDRQLEADRKWFTNQVHEIWTTYDGLHLLATHVQQDIQEFQGLFYDVSNRLRAINRATKTSSLASSNALPIRALAEFPQLKATTPGLPSPLPAPSEGLKEPVIDPSAEDVISPGEEETQLSTEAIKPAGPGPLPHISVKIGRAMRDIDDLRRHVAVADLRCRMQDKIVTDFDRVTGEFDHDVFYRQHTPCINAISSRGKEFVQAKEELKQFSNVLSNAFPDAGNAKKATGEAVASASYTEEVDDTPAPELRVKTSCATEQSGSAGSEVTSASSVAETTAASTSTSTLPSIPPAPKYTYSMTLGLTNNKTIDQLMIGEAVDIIRSLPMTLRFTPDESKEIVGGNGFKRAMNRTINVHPENGAVSWTDGSVQKYVGNKSQEFRKTCQMGSKASGKKRARAPEDDQQKAGEVVEGDASEAESPRKKLKARA